MGRQSPYPAEPVSRLVRVRSLIRGAATGACRWCRVSWSARSPEESAVSDVSAAVTPASIVCSHLSFAWPDDTPVFDDLSFTVGPGRTGLVAPNGAGKSRLLGRVAGGRRPPAGTVPVGGVLGYLPQTLPCRAESTVGDVLGVSEVLASIAAIEAGDVDERHFSVVGNAWDIEETSHALLDRLDLRGIELGRRLDTLSGGQIVQLGLAAELLAEPDVLLLDA